MSYCDHNQSRHRYIYIYIVLEMRHGLSSPETCNSHETEREEQVERYQGCDAERTRS